MEPNSLIILALPILILLGIGIVIWFVKRSQNETTDQILDQVMAQLINAQQASESSMSKLASTLTSQAEATNAKTQSLSEALAATQEDLGSLSSRFDASRQKQEVANSDLSSSFTLLEDNLSGKLNAQSHQLLTSLKVESNTEDSVEVLQSRIEAMGQGIRKLAEAQQKLTTGMSSHFGEIIKETATLKKAASAQLGRLKAIEEAAAKSDSVAEILAPLQTSADENHTLIQAVLDQLAAVSLMVADTGSSANETEQLATLLGQLQTSLEENTSTVTEQLRTLTEENSSAITAQLQSIVKDNSAAITEALHAQSGQLAELESLSKSGLSLSETLHSNQVDSSTFEQAIESLAEQSRSVTQSVQHMFDEIKQSSLSMADQEQASEDASDNLVKEIESSNEALMSAIHAQKEEMRDRIEEVSMFFADELTGLQNAQKKAEQQQQELHDLMVLLRGQRLANMRIAEQADSAQVAAGASTDEKLKIETKEFIQYLSQARIDRIKDKNTGEVTLFEYTDGVKSASETYVNDVLRFRWLFNRHGQITQSIEYDEKGFEVEECDYNGQGEVVARRSSKPQTNTKAEIGESGLIFP